MILCFYITMLGLMQDTYGISDYTTPASDRQFLDFLITKAIPEHGSKDDGELQDPISINGRSVIFEFKGSGNAQILFHMVVTEGPLNDVFLVELGGGTNYSRVGIYDSSDITFHTTKTFNSGTVPDITSANEYRYFWIAWIVHEMSIHVGTGHAIHDNEILSASRPDLEPYDVYLDRISVVSISTTSSNIGYWRFNNPITAIGTPSKTPSNTQAASEPELAATSFTQKTTISLSISTTESRTIPPTKVPTTQVQSSIVINSETTKMSVPEQDTSTLTMTEQRSVHAYNVTETEYSSSTSLSSSFYTTNTLSTQQDDQGTQKSFLDEPGNVAAIGVVGGAAGLGAIGMAAYSIKKQCTEMNTVSV